MSKGILTKNRGAYLEKVLSVLQWPGYDVDFRLVNMANYGVPQIRKRVIIMGNRLGIPVNFLKLITLMNQTQISPSGSVVGRSWKI